LKCVNPALKFCFRKYVLKTPVKLQVMLGLEKNNSSISKLSLPGKSTILTLMITTSQTLFVKRKAKHEIWRPWKCNKD